MSEFISSSIAVSSCGINADIDINDKILEITTEIDKFFEDYDEMYYIHIITNKITLYEKSYILNIYMSEEMFFTFTLEYGNKFNIIDLDMC